MFNDFLLWIFFSPLKEVVVQTCYRFTAIQKKTAEERQSEGKEAPVILAKQQNNFSIFSLNSNKILYIHG